MGMGLWEGFLGMEMVKGREMMAWLGHLLG